MREQGVGGDVEGHTEENVGAPLIELAGQLSICDIKLEQAVAGRQRHIFHLCRVPCADDQAAGVWIGPDLMDEIGNLVDRTAIRPRPGAPLRAVNGPEVALLIGPFIPDPHPVFLEVADIRIARKEPEQLMNDRFQMQLLRGEDRKAFRKVKAHLVAENTVGADTGAVRLEDTVTPNGTKKIKILFHWAIFGSNHGTYSKNRAKAARWTVRIRGRRTNDNCAILDSGAPFSRSFHRETPALPDLRSQAPKGRGRSGPAFRYRRQPRFPEPSHCPFLSAKAAPHPQNSWLARAPGSRRRAG